MVSSPAPLAAPPGLRSRRRKEGRPPGSREPPASRSLLRPAASSPASPNFGVSGKVHSGVWGLSLSSQEHPAAASQHLTRSEHAVKNSGGDAVAPVLRWAGADFVVGCGRVSVLPPISYCPDFGFSCVRWMRTARLTSQRRNAPDKGSAGQAKALERAGGWGGCADPKAALDTKSP